MAYFKGYPYITENIDASYDLFLEKIAAIIKIADQMFVTQIHEDYGLYPKGFAEWLKKHPGYKTHPFTITRFEKDEVKEIPYSVFFAKSNKRIVSLLQEAIAYLDIINDASIDKVWWRKYLTLLQGAFAEDTWEETEAFFLTTPDDNPLLLCLGPIDAYHDRLLGTKRIYSAWLLWRNCTKQKTINPLWETLTTVTRAQNPKRVSVPMKLFVGDLLYSGGEIAKHNSIGWSRPENAVVAKSLGTVKTIAVNKLPEHTAKMTAAIQNLLYKSNLSERAKANLLTFHQENSILPLLLHEFGHTFDKHDNAHALLGKHYALIEEARANTNMLYLALLMEDQKKLPKLSAVNIFLRVVFYIGYLHEEFVTKKQREEYLFAGLLWLYKAREHGLIKIQKDRLIFDETNIENHLETILLETRAQIHDLIVKDNNKEIISNLKKNIFLFGENVAKHLGFI